MKEHTCTTRQWGISHKGIHHYTCAPVGQDQVCDSWGSAPFDVVALLQPHAGAIPRVDLEEGLWREASVLVEPPIGRWSFAMSKHNVKQREG